MQVFGVKPYALLALASAGACVSEALQAYSQRQPDLAMGLDFTQNLFMQPAVATCQNLHAGMHGQRIALPIGHDAPRTLNDWHKSAIIHFAHDSAVKAEVYLACRKAHVAIACAAVDAPFGGCDEVIVGRPVGFKDKFGIA